MGTWQIILLVIVLIIIGLLLYVRFIGTSGFIVKEYPVYSDTLPSNFDGLKVVHISDIHYGSMGEAKLSKIVDEINIIKPDIVVFTGDLYDEFTVLTEDSKKELIETLSKITATIGKYAVSGNHDYSNDGYPQLIEDCGFTYLNSNSKIIYYHGNTPIEIVGYPSYLNDTPNYDYALSDYFKIALIHEPDAIDNLTNKNIDLVLAGHSHGGQVRLPFIGALTTPEGSKKYYDAYYTVGNSKLYVSYGLGTVLLPVRFFDRPSFNVYRLYSNNKN
jgi:predicted MPP superfamily phosphohydrolase